MYKPGDSFGSYVLGSIVERGEATTTYRALRLGQGAFGRRVTVEVLHPHVTSRVDIAERFVERARRFSEVIHPNVLSIEDLGRSKGCLWCVCPWTGSIALDRLGEALESRSEPFPTRLWAWLILQAGEGLLALGGAGHGRQDGSCHEDVSASTLRVDRSGRVLVPPPRMHLGGREEHSSDHGGDVRRLAAVLRSLIQQRSAEPGAAGHDDSILRLATEASRREPGDRPAIAAFVRALRHETEGLLRPRDWERVSAFDALWNDPIGPRDPVDPTTIEASGVARQQVLADCGDAAPQALAGELDVEAPSDEVTLEIGSVPEALAPSAEEGGSSPRAAPRLRLVRGAGAEPLILATERQDRWVVGRADGVDLFIDDPDVSREHFEVVREPDGELTIYDLGSKNGLFVNGRSVHEHRLRADDEIDLGRSRLRFEP